MLKDCFHWAHLSVSYISHWAALGTLNSTFQSEMISSEMLVFYWENLITFFNIKLLIFFAQIVRWFMIHWLKI